MDLITKVEIAVAGLGLTLTTLGLVLTGCVPLAPVGATLTAVAFGMLLKGAGET